MVEIPLPDGTRLRREYSLASLPADGQAELIVRRTTDGAGQPGPGSDWLTRQLQTGGLLRMRIRENPGFHSSDDRRPMVLIGAGSGLSGLVAHIRQRASAKAPGPVWLLFGERSRGHDAILDAELQDWLRSGVLRRLDRAFSRDGDGPRYVHELLRLNAATLADWDAQGAGFYICGRREGMGRDAERALADILGDVWFQALALSGRWLRDLY
ncbi:hypothetical protein [Paracoccus siganidrum]|uniref:NADPH--hemoprotein reductase n=1 Tax=Paracoccus siganidrum TaxID=1276757 RepID=A0A418ZRL5_9RHOB|nr:hypothetical protein [Paracoccus siganidrum]RJK99328.1 hypothetical protein D3P05_23365 [Paracoccus siganidrum]RMC35231.1 hypothetical protein C9E82_11560 [Paracoccus siganidrum]